MRAWGNKLVKSPKLAQYEIALIKHMKATCGAAPWIGDLEMEVIITFGDRRRRDIQNYFDIICDCGNNILYLDDSQIIKITGEKFYKKDIWQIEIILHQP